MTSLLQRWRSRLVTVAAPLLVAVGCSTSNPTEVHRETATILAVGDSIFEWHLPDGGSVPQVVGQQLDRSVYNVAVGGAFFSSPPEGEASDEADIRDQYAAAGRTDFDWVVMNGGANDLKRGCGCADCDDVLDGLISGDGATGDIVDFARNLVDDGAQVMIVGYYQIRDDAAFGYADCSTALAEHDRRLAQLAASMDNVFHVSTTGVVTAADRSAYADDRFHPSPAGSKLIGELVAAAILDAEGG